MGELQKLYVTLALNAAEFAKGLSGAEQEARSFGGRIGGALSGVGAVARTAFLGVGVAAAGGFAMAMGSAINMNASLETSTLQFTTLMGSAEQAQAHVQNLFDFAAATPYESQQIIDASLKLQTFGGEALNTMENLTLVGDAAAAVNAPIDEVAFWVGRLYSNLQAGAPFGEAAMRLQELGIMAPAAKTELENMQAAGLSGTEIFAAFQGQLGTFTGAMEAQAGTWQGLLSTIKDNLAMAAADGLRPFFDLAKQGLEGLAKWLSSPEVQEGIKKIAEGFRLLIEKVAVFVTQHVVPFLQEHGPTLVDILLGVGAALAALSIISTVAGWIGGLVEAWGAVSAAVAAGSTTLSAIVAVLGGPVTLVIAAVAALVGLLAVAWKNDWGGIQEKTEKVVSFIKDLVEKFISGIKAWWEENGEQIIESVRHMWDQVKMLFETAKRNIEDVIAALKAFFRGDFEEMERLLTDIWERTWTAIIDTVAKLWTFIKPKFETWLENIKTWFQEDAKEGIKTKVHDILEGLAEWFGKLWEYVGPKFVEMWESVKTWFAEKVQEAIQLGKDIIGGIVQGLQAVGHMITQTIMSFMQAAWDRITSFWEIESPSRRMYEAGEMIGQGMVDGLVAAMPAVAGTVDDMIGLLDQIVEAAGEVPGRLETALGLAGSFGNIAGGFAARFTQQVIAPLEGSLGAVREDITVYTDALAGMFESLGLSMDYIDHPGIISTLLRYMNSPLATVEQQGIASNALNILYQRQSLLQDEARLQDELVQQQQRLFMLEQQRADLAYLQQQLDLIELLQANALDPNLLAGVQFGLNADPGSLMTLMTRIMGAMIDRANNELSGFGVQPVAADMPGPERGSVNVQQQTINGGQHIYIYDAEVGELERLGVLAR